MNYNLYLKILLSHYFNNNILFELNSKYNQPYNYQII